jgi:CelD/BcsL family acetyltransferase involved in cellulose biosynthesis
MRIEVIDTFDKFENARPSWDAVYNADPDAQFFLSWQWFSQLFSRRPKSIYILAVVASEKPEDYTAFFPLRLTTRFSQSRKKEVNEIYMGGNFWADYTGFICDPHYECSAIPALAAHLKKMNWTRLQLENIHASAHRIDLFTTQFASPSSFDDYLQDHLSTKTRQKIRRFMRKLDASDEFCIVESTLETRQRDLDALADLWKTKWLARKGKKVDILAKKYRRIVEQGLENGNLYMPLLLHNKRPVAILASFVDRQKKCVLFFVTGRDQSWNTLPSGLLLHAHSIRWAIEQGMKTYDLLRGNEPYKYSLGAKEKSIACIRVEPRRHARPDEH